MSSWFQTRSVLSLGTRSVSLLLLLVGSGAYAHDPIPVPIAVSASALDRAVIVTSFGPLLREGASARFLCETESVAEVARYLIAPDASVVALADRWLATWDPVACAWQRSEATRLPITDAQLDTAIGTLFVLTSDAQSSLPGERTALLAASRPYRELTTLARFPDVAAVSVLAAPGARVVYLAGSSADHAPALLRSRDGGASFERLKPASDLTIGIYRLLHVDAARSERILVRASGVEGDFVMRSDDGGSTLYRVPEVQGRALRAVRLTDGEVALLAEDELEQRLYVGGFERPFRALSVPERLRDLTSTGEQLVGLAEATAGGLTLFWSLDRGASWTKHGSVVRAATIERCLESRAECVASCRHMVDIGWIASAACPEESQASTYPRPPVIGTATDPARAGERVNEAQSSESCATSAPNSLAASLLWLLARVRRRLRRQPTAFIRQHA